MRSPFSNLVNVSDDVYMQISIREHAPEAALSGLKLQLRANLRWNLQLGNQDLLSAVTMNNRSNFIANSMDINMGKHSYIQSGYTYVNGAALNYRQWYVSWGYRFDKKQTENEFVQSPDSKH